MIATGLVRRIDDLGRVVIPREVRQRLKIREGAPLEVFITNDGEVIFKKYMPTIIDDLRNSSDTIRQYLQDNGASYEVQNEAEQHLRALIKMLEKDYRD